MSLGSNNIYKFLNIDGEVAKHIKSINWEDNALGEIDKWPQSLVHTLSTMLRTKVPMFLWWGKEHFQFYNDAYIKYFSDIKLHPHIIGKVPNEDSQSYWAFMKGKIEQILLDDITDYLDENISSNLNELATSYNKYQFSKILDFEGGIGGVLVVVNDNVKTKESVDSISKKIIKLIESEKSLRFLLNDAPVPILIIKGQNLIIENINNEMRRTLYRENVEVIGFGVSEIWPEFQEQGFIDALKNVFITGLPFKGVERRILIKNTSGELQDLYANFVFQPIQDELGNTTHLMVVGNVITEEVLAKKEIEKAQEMLKFSIEAANVGTWNLNLLTDEFLASDRLKELFGYSANTKASFDELLMKVPAEYVPIIKEKIENCITTGEDYILEHPVVFSNNHPERWIRALGKIYIDEITRVKQFSGIMIDVTSLKKDDQRKNDFIGMVSHELKTPITSLSAYLEILKVKTKNEKFLTEVLGKASHQVRKMNSLINGFLNVSRLESGKIHLHRTSFNLIVLIEEAIEEIKLSAGTHHIVKNYPSEIVINADYDKVLSVMSNLLSNAHKYSHGTSKIEISMVEKINQVEVCVKDEGIGIAQSEINKLFNRFYRSESNTLKHISGFGIGLYVCSEIISRHNGQIWVESELGKGSNFCFSLPIE